MDNNFALRIYGVLGYPARHSLSPAMHNAAFRALNIHAEYKIFEKRPEELEDFLFSLAENNIYGINVTIPYKEAVLKYLQWLSPEARFTEAVNVIIAQENKSLKGWNTDGIGFHRHLTKELKFSIRGKKIVVLGAGGAGKAITNQLARKGAQSISIYDINKNRGLSLTRKLKEEFPATNTTFADSIDGLDINNADLLVNATPVGMKEGEPCLIGPDRFHCGLLVYDLIYNPPQTALLKIAQEKGAAVSNGLGMLLYQGVLSFQHFTGVKTAPIEIMRNALQEAVREL